MSAIAFDKLMATFRPETRNLTAGKATRYTGGKCLISFPTDNGAANYICRSRRLRPGQAKPGDWRQHPHAGGRVIVNQTPADYESGAAYEVMARDLQTGDCAPARVDWPPGVETLGRPGRELIKARPIIRTDSAILLWIRADASIRQAARMAQPAPGPCAYLLIDNFFPGMELELTLTITAGATGQTGLTANPHPRRGSFPRRPLGLRGGEKLKSIPPQAV